MKKIILNKSLLLFIFVVILSMFLLKQCDNVSKLKKEIEMIEKVSQRNLNNYKASHDSISTEISKNGTLVYKISSYEYDISVLKEKNSDILKKYAGVLKYNQKLENINNLISVDLVIKDSIINSQVVLKQNGNNTLFTFSDKKEWDKYNWRIFSGTLNLIKSDSIYNIESSRFDFIQGISLKTAIVREDNRDILKISTIYPGIEFTKIENINLVNDKLNSKPIRNAGWGIGVGLSYGINLNNTQVISNGPSIGVGIYYSPKWLKF